ncbi:hypothetical protein ND440_17220 (plasmid) [Yersinia ruckeri]|uniref:hypothetical protein n=1 Tax=Yersinia ruckeri TaxID=29486 RepID=UPI0022375F6D|nr:hypothetical protein [Yersinia ruckeri]MCW6550154.1 hypothetical protein [Yersinia ruckeri]MCW6572761.1 hypothetical protein [Yersinia ruckeri]UZX67010.1 hypothetical protein ND440_17220 [Yersinia ruckeri]
MPSEWLTSVLPVVSAIAGGVVGGATTQGFTLWRERRQINDRRKNDRKFIGAELIVRLRELSYRCREVGFDIGIFANGPGPGEYEIVPECQVGDFLLDDVKGDWTTLPGEILLRIRELPLRLQELERWLMNFDEVHGDPPDNEEYFKHRRELYTYLSQEIDSLTDKLCQECGLPQSYLYPLFIADEKDIVTP